MMRAAVILALGLSSFGAAACELTKPSDELPGRPILFHAQNENYPHELRELDAPWLQYSFATEPLRYAESVNGYLRGSIRLQDGKVMVDHSRWWSVPFMNYTNNGREYFNGLSKERSPQEGELAPSSPGTYQVWAIGLYNERGAYQLGKIWEDKCEPDETAARAFPDRTASIKLLFSDADPAVVHYLAGSPQVDAAVDPGNGGPPEERVTRKLRLLAVDFAIKDSRSVSTGWVFGTFAWVGPPKGDGLFDNLRLVGLHWGNDPGMRSDYRESYVNEEMRGLLFGWDTRPTMGFEGRMNGPADNPSSSCLSCHSRAQAPRAAGGLAGRMPDLTQTADVQDHLKKYFGDVVGGTLADETTGQVPLDYSLHMLTAWERECLACMSGDLASTSAPKICRFFPFSRGVEKCAASREEADRNYAERPVLKWLMAPPSPF